MCTAIQTIQVADCVLASLGLKSLDNLVGIVVETVDGELGVLADFDDVAVGITHVAAPFPAVIVSPWLGKKQCSFLTPLFVAGPDVGDTQIEEATYSVQIRWCFKKNLWLVGSRATAGIENNPRIFELDVAGILWLDQFPA